MTIVGVDCCFYKAVEKGVIEIACGGKGCGVEGNFFGFIAIENAVVKVGTVNGSYLQGAILSEVIVIDN